MGHGRPLILILHTHKQRKHSLSDETVFMHSNITFFAAAVAANYWCCMVKILLLNFLVVN